MGAKFGGLISLALLGALGGGCGHPRQGHDLCASLGAAGCVTGEDVAFTCIGGVYRETKCDDGERCAAGACRPVSCTPSLFFCDGSFADVCDATGTLETRTDCAATGADCVVQASTAACVTRTCAPSTTYCAPDGSEVRKCAPDGMSFEVVQSCNDSAGRGNHCVGATCIDRCALLEAQDRSTLGCRFAGAAESAQPEVVIANPQPDLPAQVTIANAGAGGSPMTKVVPPGGSLAIAWTATSPSGSSQAARALYVTASVPIYAWLNEPSANVALFPEHALSTSYLAGLDAGANQLLSAVATVDGTQLTATVTAAVAAGPGVAATSAGGTLTTTLDRGDVLTLASSGSLDGSRVQATAPIAVTLASSSGALALPGADTLGREVIVPDPALVIARDAATVTTEVEGTLTLAAGAEATLAGNERISSTAPILVIDQLGGREVVPPVEQLRTTSFPAWASGASVTVQLIAPQPLTVAGGGASYPLSASGSFASGSFGFTPRLLSAPMPFFAFFRNNTDIAPGAFGLALLP